MEWSEKWIDEMVRVTKPTGSIFVINFPRWLIYYTQFLNKRAIFRNWIAWSALSIPTGKCLLPAHYGILFYVKNYENTKVYRVRLPHERNKDTGRLVKNYGGHIDLLHPFGPLVSDIWTDILRILHAKYRDKHPCQMPLPLMERLILMTTDEGDIILDPFMGVGSTAIAAKKLGRNFIGFELSEEYKAIADKKLSETKSDSKLGDCWVSYSFGSLRTIRNDDWGKLSHYFDIPKTKKEIVMTGIRLKNET